MRYRRAKEIGKKWTEPKVLALARAPRAGLMDLADWPRWPRHVRVNSRRIPKADRARDPRGGRDPRISWDRPIFSRLADFQRDPRAG